MDRLDRVHELPSTSGPGHVSAADDNIKPASATTNNATTHSPDCRCSTNTCVLTELDLSSATSMGPPEHLFAMSMGSGALCVKISGWSCGEEQDPLAEQVE